MDKKVITEYRDKIRIERNKILNEYAIQTKDKGEMYYVYDEKDTFLLCVCDENRSHEVISVEKNNLPDDIEVGSVLRMENDNYILDIQGTNDIKLILDEKTNQLIQEQNEYLKGFRKEGHIYEVSEIGEDRLWLFDLTENSGEEIEEIEIGLEILDSIKPEDKLIYEDGVYKKTESM